VVYVVSQEICHHQQKHNPLQTLDHLPLSEIYLLYRLIPNHSHLTQKVYQILEERQAKGKLLNLS